MAILLKCERSIAGQSVLVTGHTGFTGGWLSLWLDAIGAKVTGVALEPITSPNLYEAAGVGESVTSHIANINDASHVANIMADAKPRVVFHLAAQPLVSKSFDDPLETMATNVMGTANVIEAARNTPGIEAVVCITTDKVYADQDWPWGYREIDALGGKDPYSASKACAELVAASYRAALSARGNGVKIATARGGNIIGGGDWADNRIVPDFVRAIVSGDELTLRNPGAVRPWQHVLALCHGYLTLADRLLSDKPLDDGAWNFGPLDDEAHPVSALVEAMQKHWRPANITYGHGSFPETNFLHLDSTKARRQLKWAPPLDFDSTIKFTTQWYREYYGVPDAARNITTRQIAAYREATQDLGQ